ncbi:MAG: histidine phosphatase family protein [Bacteriovoracaceae bacterium]
MKKIDIFIFRHGETEWNRLHRFQGHTDIPLNENGKSQALVLTKQLAELRPEVILTSDLIRAVETAQIANLNLNVPTFVSKNLRECHLGEPEGLFRDEVLKKYGQDSWEIWSSNDPASFEFSFPGGEKKIDHLNRMKNHISEFCFDNPHYSKIAISTHGGSLRRLVHNCKDSPAQPIKIPNCALYKIQFDMKSLEWYFVGLVK